MRVEQYPISKNKSCARPRLCLCLDTETSEQVVFDRKILRFKLGVTQFFRYNKKTKSPRIEEKVFHSKQSINNYIISKINKKSTLYIFTHNAAFDIWITGFLPFLGKEQWKLGFIYINGLTFILTVRKESSKIVILSTTNFFPFSLEKCGKMLSLLKRKVKFKSVSIEDLIAYCKQDTSIVTRLVQEYLNFIDAYDLGKFSYTRPSQAMCAFRHRFMHHNIYVHKEEKIIALEKACYFGGRCELWEQGLIGNGPFQSYDINSMYPFIMLNNVFPTRLCYFKEKSDIGIVKTALQNFSICCHCLIKTDIPLYPVRGKHKTVFPIGEFEAFLTTPAIKKAINYDHLKAVYEIAFYDQDAIFVDFINYFYGLRRQFQDIKNDIMQFNAKILMNALYGKFAELIPELEIYDTDDMTLKREKVVIHGKDTAYTMYQLLGKVIIEKEKHIGKRSLIAISAHITAMGRQLLNDIIQSIGFGRILYCDTDSIKGRAQDMKILNYPISDTQLGALKDEGRTNHFVINGLKDYVWGNTEVIKGVKKGSEKISDFEYLGERFMKPKTLMKYGIEDYVVIVEAPKTLKRDYDKGVVLPNKKIRPYKLPEESAFIF